MGLPRGDGLMKASRVAFGREPLPQFAVGEQLRQFREDLQVPFGRMLGYQQEEHEIHRLDPAMRNGHALAQTRRAQALAREQAVEHDAAPYALVVLEQQAGLLEHALLAGDIQIQKDVRRGKEFGDEVHWRGERSGTSAMTRCTTRFAGRSGAQFYTFWQQRKRPAKRWGRIGVCIRLPISGSCEVATSRNREIVDSRASQAVWFLL